MSHHKDPFIIAAALLAFAIATPSCSDWRRSQSSQIRPYADPVPATAPIADDITEECERMRSLVDELETLEGAERLDYGSDLDDYQRQQHDREGACNGDRGGPGHGCPQGVGR